MRPEEIDQFLQGLIINPNSGGAHTHLAMIDDRMEKLLLDTTESTGCEQMSKCVYEASRLKRPLALSELVETPFRMFFELKLTTPDLSADVKTVCGWLCKAMPQFFAEFKGKPFDCWIFASADDGKAQARGTETGTRVRV